MVITERVRAAAARLAATAERRRRKTVCRADIFLHILTKPQMVAVEAVERWTKMVLVSFILNLLNLNEVCFTRS